MPTLPEVIVTLLLPFERLFDRRTWRKAQLLVVGAILSPGKRTVSSALSILGIGQHGDFAVFHQVLNRARWQPLQLSPVLLLLVVGRLGSSTEPLVFALDIADQDGLDNASFSYQWLAGDAEISGATGSTYVLTDADAGKGFRVRVSFTDDAGYEESLTSELVGPERPHGLNALESDGAVMLTWKPPVVLSNLRSLVYYQILRNRPELEETEPQVYVEYMRADETSYTDTGVGPEVLYVYRVKAADHFGRLGEASDPVEIRTSESVPVRNIPASGAPAITGTAQVGETLSALTSGIADTDGLENATFTYQWIRSDGGTDTDIAGATGSTYTLTDAEEGKNVKVRVSFTDDAGNEETLTRNATGSAAAAPNRDATGTPTIDGTVQVGETLTADTSGIADEDGLDRRLVQLPVDSQRRKL